MTAPVALSPDDLAHLAHLARLDIPPDALESYAGQLGNVLALFEGLRSVDTSAIEAVLASFPDLSLTPRPDLPVPSLPTDSALAPSARQDHEYLSVPRVLKGAAGEEG